MEAEIVKLEKYRAFNPMGSLVPAIEHRIEWLKRKLGEVRIP